MTPDPETVAERQDTPPPPDTTGDAASTEKPVDDDDIEIEGFGGSSTTVTGDPAQSAPTGEQFSQTFGPGSELMTPSDNAELVMHTDRIAELERQLGILQTSYSEVCVQLDQVRKDRDEALGAHTKTAALHSAAQVQIAELNGLLEAEKRSLTTITERCENFFRANSELTRQVLSLDNTLQELRVINRKLAKRRDKYRCVAQTNSTLAQIFGAYMFAQQNAPNLTEMYTNFPTLCEAVGVRPTRTILRAFTDALLDAQSVVADQFESQVANELPAPPPPPPQNEGGERDN